MSVSSFLAFSHRYPQSLTGQAVTGSLKIANISNRIAVWLVVKLSLKVFAFIFNNGFPYERIISSGSDVRNIAKYLTPDKPMSPMAFNAL